MKVAITSEGNTAAQKIINAGAIIVFTGHCGPKAFQVLSAAKFSVVTGIKGKVSDAITLFKSGKYELNNNADVEGHW